MVISSWGGEQLIHLVIIEVKKKHKPKILMKLKKAEIINYRSISKLEIELNKSPIILVGINESGKTNILSALSLIHPENGPTDEDIRESLPDEKAPEKAHVRFIFELEDNEIETIFETLKDYFCCIDIDKPIIKDKKNAFSLLKFCLIRREGLYEVSLLPKIKKGTYYFSLSNNYEVYDGWKKISEECPDELNVTLGDKTIKQLADYRFININDLNTEHLSEINKYLKDMTSDDINGLIGQHIVDIIKENLPPCVFWEYNEKNLLPGKILVQDFKNRPDQFLPLKYMFQLAGHDDVKSAIEQAQVKSKGLVNMLNRVAEQTSKHIHTVWKECKGIQISLRENGNHIDAGIQEGNQNVFDFAKRSDGFKRFITFLLTISIRQKANKFNNILLLIDEPDLGLHPSGARYLKDELKKIGENNYVIYSTHSIFMIDEENINKHLIVKKNNETTTIEIAGHSNIKEEEVIYNALGHSIYTNLKKKNIIFEGWRDKKIFEEAIKAKGFIKDKTLKNTFNMIGKIHALGTKSIPLITEILESGERDYIILSDNDPAAKEVLKNFKGQGKWYTYKDINQNLNEITGEDFIEPNAFISILNEIKDSHTKLPAVPTQELNKENKIATIKKWLKSGEIQEGDIKTLLKQIKDTVFNSLEGDQITKNYAKLLEGVANILNSPSQKNTH